MPTKYLFFINYELLSYGKATHCEDSGHWQGLRLPPSTSNYAGLRDIVTYVFGLGLQSPGECAVGD